MSGEPVCICITAAPRALSSIFRFSLSAHCVRCRFLPVTGAPSSVHWSAYARRPLPFPTRIRRHEAKKQTNKKTASMHAEASLTFFFDPRTDSWLSEAHLRVDAEVTANQCRCTHCGSSGQTVGGCDALSSLATSSCTLLIYAARHHALHRVFVQEKERDNATDAFSDEAAGATSVSSSPADVAPDLPSEGCTLPRRIEVQHYTWKPCHRRIHHLSADNGEAMPLAKSSDKLGQPSRDKASAPMCRQGETEANSVNTGASPSSRIHVFSSSGTGLMEDFLEDEDDKEADGGERLVLHFDSSPPSSSSPFAPRAEASADEDALPASADLGEGTNTITVTEVAPSAARVPVQGGTSAAPPIPGATHESSTQTPLSMCSTESVGASLSGAPRRLMLLRPGTGAAPGSLLAAPPTEVKPAVPLPSLLSSSRGGRVLNISTAAAAKSDTLSSEPAQEAPRTPLPTSVVTTTTVATEANSGTLNVAAAAPSTTPLSASEAVGTREVCEWQTFLLSFSYPVSSTVTTTTTQRLPHLPSTSAATKGHRTVVVHLEFVAVELNETTLHPDATSIATHCSRGSVASCRWWPQCLSTRLLSPDGDACNTTHRASHGYSVIIGDASLPSRCLMCPLVAAVLPGDGGWCCDATCQSPINGGPGEVLAGPLLDVWVRAVSGRQLSTRQRRAYGNTHKVCSSMTEVVLKDQLRRRQGAARLEEPTQDEAKRCWHEKPSSLCEASRPLFTAIFTASWLSHLCCVFTPCRLATPPARHPHTGDMLKPRPARRSLWPSSHSTRLAWVATQVTQDCIVTCLRCLTDSTFSPTPRSSDVQGKVRYYWLRSDPHQSDALHLYLCRVFACWARATPAQLPASSQNLCASPCGASGIVGASLLNIIVTKANPPTLSLRGGAVGTASAVLLADETLHAAALGTEEAEEAPQAAASPRLIAAAERLRLSASALRARVAIAAAMLQHLMWGALERLDVGGKGETSKVVNVERGAVGYRERTPSAPLPLGEQHSVHLEGVTSRVVCAARALAVHWVCGSPSLVRDAPASLMDFFMEERLLLSSVLSVGHLLSNVCASPPKDCDACNPLTASSITGLNTLRYFEIEYASASLAALAWLSQHAADTQLLREEGLMPLHLHKAERALLCSALALPTSSHHGGLLRHRLSSDKGPVCRLCSYTEEPHGRFPLDDIIPDVGRSLPQAPLRGKVRVRVEHAAVMNAFTVHLEWKTISAAVCDAPPPALARDTHAAVEVPLLLLVFVVLEDVGGMEHDSADSLGTSPDESFRGTRGVDGCVVRLYQATPFSWRLSNSDCTVNGFTAHTTQLLMHALDLAARQPEVFEGFHLQAVTGLGSGAATTAVASARAGTAMKRARGPRRSADSADGSVEMGVPTSAVSSTHGILRAGPSSVQRSRAQPCTGKRRRVDVDGDRCSGGRETLSDDEDGTADAEVDDDTNVLVLNVGSKYGCRAAAGSASLPGSTSARRRRRESGFHKSLSDASLSVLDTARVVPVVVLRQDAAAPLLEVEVSQASQLAAQLAAFGSRATGSTCKNAREEHETQEEASRVLCALIDHWIGFSALHTGAPRYVANLKALGQHSALMPITQLGSMSSQTGALTVRCVLYAYADVLRSLWRELAHLSESSSHSTEDSLAVPFPLASVMSIGALRAHILDPACVATAIEAAVAEYVRQDIECRRRLLAAKRYAAAQWGSDEFAENDKKGGVVGSTGGTRQSKSKKHTKPHQQQCLEAEASTEAAARAMWAPLTMQIEGLVRAFYAEVLGVCPLPSPLLPLDNQPRAIYAETESGSYRGTAGGDAVLWNVPNSWDLAASEKRAAFLSCLRGFLQSVKADEGEGPRQPRRSDTTAPTFSLAFRLQLTGTSADKSSSQQTIPSSSKSQQWCATGAGDAAGVDVTVPQLTETCVTQLSCTPLHPCTCFAGPTSTNVGRGKKRVGMVARRPVAGGDADAQRVAHLLLANCALLLPRGKKASAASSRAHAIAAQLALPLAQLMMKAESTLH
ncbi:hypothetical protein, conserved [Leishmania tarentolae]|uniref:Uncharacterized protein n=1 Tax=Leishmania tarentolae TaxID=5689 RepID=A0A640KN86_LEITA|nr:hypothetical protein, conserved [Leishmania tarentolae]